MRPKRTYTPEERDAALAALAANEGNIKRTAVDLGIPPNTLATWRNERSAPKDHRPEGGKAARLQAKISLADALERIAWKTVRSLPKALRIATAKGSLSQIAVTLGIAVDKMRLLREQATSLPGSALSPEQKDARIAEIKAAAAARRAIAEAEKQVSAPPPPIDAEKPTDVDDLVQLADPPDRPTATEPGGGPGERKG